MRLLTWLSATVLLELVLFLFLYMRPVTAAPSPTLLLLAPTTLTAYQRAYLDEFARRCLDRDVDLIVLDARSDGERQISHLEDAVALQPDAILLMPRQPSGFTASLAKARRLGIPVGILNSRLERGEAAMSSFYVGPNNYREGETAADLLGQALHNEGRVALIEGAAGQQSSEERKAGFLHRLAAASPRIRVVEQRSGQWTENEAYEATRDMLHGSPAECPDGIFAFDDTMAAGVIRALREASVRHIAVVSINGTRAAVDRVAEGTQFATVLQSPIEEADRAFERTMQQIRDGSGPASVEIEEQAITRDNSAQYGNRAW